MAAKVDRKLKLQHAEQLFEGSSNEKNILQSFKHGICKSDRQYGSGIPLTLRSKNLETIIALCCVSDHLIDHGRKLMGLPV